MGSVVEIIQGIIQVFARWAGAVLVLLPDSPIQAMLPAMRETLRSSSVIGVMAWFFPIAQMLATLVLVLQATIIWYAIRWILRFAKYIQ